MVLRHMMEFGKINGRLTWLTHFWIISIKSFLEFSPKLNTTNVQLEGRFKRKCQLYTLQPLMCFAVFFKLGRIPIDHVYAVFGNPMVFQNNYKKKRNICSLLLHRVLCALRINAQDHTKCCSSLFTNVCQF